MSWLGLLLLTGLYAVAKLALVLGLPPADFADSPAYIRLAEDLFRAAPWVTAHDISGYPEDSTIRSMGYPILIALAKRISSTHWLLVLTIGQNLLNVICFYQAVNILNRARTPRYLLIGFTILSFFGLPLVYDLSILSDSYASYLVTLTLLWIVALIQSDQRPSLAMSCVLGVLWGCSITIRPVNLYFLILPALGWAIILWRHKRRRGWGLALLGLFITLAWLPVEAHLSWNAQRSGVRFLTRLSEVNQLWPVFNMRRTGLVDPFTGDDPVARLGRATAGDNSYTAQGAVLRGLRAEGFSAAEIQAMTRAQLLRSIAAYPGIYALSVLQNFDVTNFANVLFNPRHNMRRLNQAGPGEILFPPLAGEKEIQRSLRQGPSVSSALAFGIYYLSVGLALAGFGVVVLTPPALVIPIIRRRAALSVPERWIAGFVWLSFMCVAGSYALVHIEERMLLPVFFPTLLLLALILRGKGSQVQDPLGPGAWGPGRAALSPMTEGASPLRTSRPGGAASWTCGSDGMREALAVRGRGSL